MRRYAYGYLPSRRASPLLNWCQFILLADRGTWVCEQLAPRLLPESGTAVDRTYDFLSRKSKALALSHYAPGRTVSIPTPLATTDVSFVVKSKAILKRKPCAELPRRTLLTKTLRQFVASCKLCDASLCSHAGIINVHRVSKNVRLLFFLITLTKN